MARALHCPCCGVPYLTQGETAVVVALYAASLPVCTDDIARVTGIPKRTIRTITRGQAGLFERALKSDSYVGWRAFYSLSPEGLTVARRLTGSDVLEAAQ